MWKMLLHLHFNQNLMMMMMMIMMMMMMNRVNRNKILTMVNLDIFVLCLETIVYPDQQAYIGKLLYNR